MNEVTFGHVHPKAKMSDERAAVYYGFSKPKMNPRTRASLLRLFYLHSNSACRNAEFCVPLPTRWSTRVSTPAIPLRVISAASPGIVPVDAPQAALIPRSTHGHSYSSQTNDPSHH